MSYVSEVPPSGKTYRAGGQFWRDAAADAVARPDAAVLVGRGYKRSRIMSARKSIARYNATLEGGQVLVHQRNSTVREDGHLYADLYFQFVPEEKE